MNRTGGRRAQGGQVRRARDADYLFPNLCQGEGLLGVVVTAELLSILIVVVDRRLLIPLIRPTIILTVVVGL